MKPSYSCYKQSPYERMVETSLFAGSMSMIYASVYLAKKSLHHPKAISLALFTAASYLGLGAKGVKAESVDVHPLTQSEEICMAGLYAELD